MLLSHQYFTLKNTGASRVGRLCRFQSVLFDELDNIQQQNLIHTSGTDSISEILGIMCC